MNTTTTKWWDKIKMNYANANNNLKMMTLKNTKNRLQILYVIFITLKFYVKLDKFRISTSIWNASLFSLEKWILVRCTQFDGVSLVSHKALAKWIEYTIQKKKQTNKFIASNWSNLINYFNELFLPMTSWLRFDFANIQTFDISSFYAWHTDFNC